LKTRTSEINYQIAKALMRGTKRSPKLHNTCKMGHEKLGSLEYDILDNSIQHVKGKAMNTNIREPALL